MSQRLNKDDAIVPSHVKTFACQKCGLCCKQVWNIFIDQKTYEIIRQRYQEQGRNAEFAELFTPYDPVNKRALLKYRGGQCAALTPDNLCGLQKEFGMDALCDTCRVYPRHSHVTSRGFEFALALSCPTAAATMLQKEPIKIERNPEGFAFVRPHFMQFFVPEEIEEGYVKRHYYLVEERMIGLLQNRNYGVEDRFIVLGEVLRELVLVDKQATPEKISKLFDEAFDRWAGAAASVVADYAYQIDQITNFMNHRLKLKAAPSTTNTIYNIYRELALKEKGLSLAEAVEFFALEPLNIKIPADLYASKVKKYFRREARDLEHVFENYAVNYLLGKPFYFYDFPSSYFLMIYLTAAVRFLAVGYASFLKQSVDEKILLHSMMELALGMSHAQVFLAALRKRIGQYPLAQIVNRGQVLARS